MRQMHPLKPSDGSGMAGASGITSLSQTWRSAEAPAGQRAGHDNLAALRPATPVLATDVPVGDALRRARQSLGLEIDDIAQATHVRAAFIDALERRDLEPLPARPFAVGYVRAYARALGLDPDQVAARFRKELPDETASLRPPPGIRSRRRARFGGPLLVGLIVVASLAGWNLFVRVAAAPHRFASPVAAPAAEGGQPIGPEMLGAPLPAPPEASSPPPYETPGLAAATAANGSPAAAEVTARIAAEAAAAHPQTVAPGTAFVAHGTVFGARAGGGAIVQALRPFSLVVRGAGGEVYFARELAAGEAWRAPAIAGLTVDADTPAAAEVYLGGRAEGPLTETQTAVESLTTAKPAPA